MKITKAFAALAAAVIGVMLVAPAAAQAADGFNPVPNACDKAWGVPDDETALMPTQTAEGLLFDGPSIVHRQVTPMALADVPPGHLTTVGDVTGDKPLFKMETSEPYSTINVTGSGLFWSSKIAADQPGGQSHPIEHASELAKLAPYTDATKVKTIGAGYANDEGNVATVSAITWNGTTYDLTCAPPTSASPSPSKTAGATPEPSRSSRPAGAAITTTPAPGSGASLPITGHPVAAVAGVGAGLLALGVLFLVARRRKTTRWQA